MQQKAGFITSFDKHVAELGIQAHTTLSRIRFLCHLYTWCAFESPLKLAMTRLILALLASALSQDVADPSGEIALPHGPLVPMSSTRTSTITTTPPAEFDDVTWTSSLLLIGFVVASMGILCLVNYFDKHIRKESWALLSTTVSIFSAASLDFAVYRLLEFSLDIEEHDSAHHMARQCGILSLCCLVVFGILQKLLLNHSGQHILFAISSLGSHIYAFASILVFGNMQEWNFSSQVTLWVWSIPFVTLWVWFIPFLAFGVMFLLYKLMLLMFTGREYRSQMSENEEQLKTAIEVHIDASAISVAFLLVQALCYTLSLPDQDQPKETHEERFMPITNGSPGQHVDYAWLKLFVWALVFLAFSSIWSACLNSKRKCCRVCMDFIGETASDFIGRLASVTGSWCLQRGGMLGWFHVVRWRMDWYLEQHCKIHGVCSNKIHFARIQAAHRAQILNAYTMTIFAILVVIGMDKLADCIEADDRYHHSAAIGLRFVMSGLGVLVGICWDKAFETAYETILEPRSIDNLMGGEEDELYKLIHNDHPIKAQLCIVGVGIVMSWLVARAWYLFIAPHAMKETEDHEEEIELQEKSYATLATPKTTPKSIPLSTSESSSE